MKKSRILVFMLVAALMLSTCMTAFAATTSNEITQREKDSSEFALYAATQGMVLLENEGVLPIAKEGKIALFGGGASKTIKGGTGSGDVNQREIVTVAQGFKNAGYEITSKAYLDAFDAKYAEENQDGGGFLGSANFVDDIADIDGYIKTAVDAGTDTAIYVVYRNSGEFADRHNAKGDYELTDIERANIEKMANAFENSIVVLNVGGIVDTKFYKEIEKLDALFLMSQAGMRGGDALVQVLNGTVNPSGKLTDTWPVNYSDYGIADTFSFNDNDVNHEYYVDDIYVGYRYFDTFGKEVAYPFGYGSSYTTFDITIDSVKADEKTVTVAATVKNTGDVSGKEVVQVYFSAPDGELEKPYQELAGYAKTDELKPGQSQTLTISYNVADMSSYSMDKAAYILEAGDYVIRVGNSSRNTHAGAVLTVDKTVITEQLSNQMVQDEEFEIFTKKGQTPITYNGEAKEISSAKKIKIDSSKVKSENNASKYDDEEIISYVYEGSDYTPAEGARYTKGKSGNPTVEAIKVFDSADGKEKIENLGKKKIENPTLRDVATGKITMTEFVADLSVEELANIVEGVGWSAPATPIVGAQANSVNGAAGETTALYYETRLIPNIVLPDGPAGIRITQQYEKDGVTYYQFATAFPIGTLIAMTWDKDVIKEFGNRIGTEKEEFGTTLWLAPGMNIHRNALCGRNFEYYSEDPLVAGLTAAYATLGVQSHPGIGVTLKHYALNNQEENRNAVNNTVTERAIREIYLKGFEIAVKMAQPMAIMTSYNQNNSMPAADDYDLCTDIPRGEWGFEGLIMTDWGGGQSQPVNSMHAGNDLIMPGGSTQDIINMFTTTRPSFDEETGYVKTTYIEFFPGFGWTTEDWGEFVLAADGKDTESVTVKADPSANENVAKKVADGTATVKDNGNGTWTVTYKGNYADNALPLGDLQKSAANVLHIIMNSSQFEKITKEYEGEVVKVKPYSEQYDLATYVTSTKSELDCPSAKFTDVPPTENWAHAGIDYCVANNLMQGISDTEFSPKGLTSRAQMVTILYRAAGEPKTEYKATFADVPDGTWYSAAVEWAAANDVVKGVGDGSKFAPNDNITREQIATILYRYAGEPKVEGDLSKFPDAGKVSTWAADGMLWATSNGIVTGASSNGVTTLNPQDNATREQIAAIIARYAQQ